MREKLARLLEKRWAAYTFALCAAVLLYVLLTHMTGPIMGAIRAAIAIATPVIIGVVLAYLIDPLAVIFERRVFKRMANEGLRRVLGIVLAIACIVLAIVLLILILVPALVSGGSKAIANVSTAGDTVDAFVAWANSLELPLGLDINLDFKSDSLIEMMRGYAGELGTYISNNAGALFESLTLAGSALGSFGMGILLAIYFLFSKDALIKGINRLRRALVSPERYERHNAFLWRCHKILVAYLGCSLVDVFIVSGLTGIFMLLTGLPYAALLALLMGVLNLIPVFGSMIGTLLGTFLIVLEDPWGAVWFFAFTSVLIFIDGNLIRPRLFNNSLGIPAVWTLVAVVIGGAMFGVAGMLLAIPVAAVLTFAYTELVLPRLEARRVRLEDENLREEFEGAVADVPEAGIGV